MGQINEPGDGDNVRSRYLPSLAEAAAHPIIDGAHCVAVT
jgi:hypothetical protein